MKALRAYPAGKIFGFESILNRPSPKRDAPGAECGEILTNEIRDVPSSTIATGASLRLTQAMKQDLAPQGSSAPRIYSTAFARRSHCH